MTCLMLMDLATYKQNLFSMLDATQEHLRQTKRPRNHSMVDTNRRPKRPCEQSQNSLNVTILG